MSGSSGVLCHVAEAKNIKKTMVFANIDVITIEKTVVFAILDVKTIEKTVFFASLDVKIIEKNCAFCKHRCKNNRKNCVFCKPRCKNHRKTCGFCNFRQASRYMQKLTFPFFARREIHIRKTIGFNCHICCFPCPEAKEYFATPPEQKTLKKLWYLQTSM